jgi:serine protease AprX
MRARLQAIICLIVASSAGAGGAQLLPPPSGELDKLDPVIRQEVQELTRRSRVIVRARDAASLDAVAALIVLAGGTLGRELPLIEAHAADVPNAAILTLAASALVQRIASDRPTFSFDERTAATIGADVVRQQFGYDGAGIRIAVIDSGVTAWHDDLEDPAAPGTQRIDGFVDFVSEAPTPYDDYGHGTHVAGIIAGNGAASVGARAGLAPASRLVVLKVLDAAGRGRISDAIAAIDYVVEHRTQLDIRLINLSLGAIVHESYTADLLTLATRRAVEHGLVVVAAAGNRGRNSEGGVLHGAISAPANAPWVLTVGASSHMGTPDRGDDTVAAFSSRGPTAFDYTAKPDLVAPGVGIYSLSAPDSTMYQTHAPYLLSGADPGEYPYLSLSGTSQAAPVVAGVVALMLQANPSLTPNAVKAILQYTAEPYAGHAALAQGAGFLDAKGAVDLARMFSTPVESRPPSPPEWGRSIVWGNQRLGGGHLPASAGAWDAPVAWGAECDPAGCGAVADGLDAPVNVVWGSTCAGDDCDEAEWTTGADDSVMWGHSAEQDTIVWGNTDDGDTIVWGNTDDGDTIVWGNSDPTACQPVLWPE